MPKEGTNSDSPASNNTLGGLDVNKLSININFESHPPIESDQEGVFALLKQLFLDGINCKKLATYLISLKDITQVLVTTDEDGAGKDEGDDNDDDDDDESNDEIYGVASVVDLSGATSDSVSQLVEYLSAKCPNFKEIVRKSDEKHKTCLVINERMVNLPPQLALPTLKALESVLDGYHSIVIIAKILKKPPRIRGTRDSIKRAKTDDYNHDELVFVNPEEEIFYENCAHHTDIKVSPDEDSSYIKLRRIMTIDRSKWSKIMSELEKELK